MADNFEVTETFDGETGLKTGAQLEDLVAEAKFAVGSDALDKTTLEDDGAGKARIKAAGVDTAQIAADAVDKTKIAADVAGDGLGQNADGSLEVNVDDTGIEINADTLRLKDDGVVTAKILDANVTVAKLEAGILDAGAPTYVQDQNAHQATKLSLIVGWGAANANNTQLTVYSDSSNPPTTARFNVGRIASGYNGGFFGICRKNEYYKVAATAGSVSALAYYVYPIGP